jgi:outer membrane protein
LRSIIFCHFCQQLLLFSHKICIFANPTEKYFIYFKKRFKSVKKTLVILAISAGMYACQSDSKTTDGTQKSNSSSKKDDNINKSIVYVNSDSLFLNYEFYKKSTKELETKKGQFDTDLNSRASQFQQEVARFQQVAPSMTMKDVENTKQVLTQKEQTLMQYKESLGKQLADDEQKMSAKMAENMDLFMKKFAEKNNYKMIVGYKQGVTLWYADTRLDVTKEAIKGLNEEYQKQATIAPVTPEIKK